MSITPLGLNAMLQRTNDVGTIKHQEDTKPAVEQHSIQSQQSKMEHDLTHKVSNTEEKDNENFRYDAKEKGNGSYQGKRKKKKTVKEKVEVSENGRVILKGQAERFDIKI